MKKKVILSLCFVLVALFAISSGITFAWLTQENKLPELNLSIGELKYTVSQTGNPTAEIVPGDALGTLTIANESNIKSNVRVVVKATATKAGSASAENWTIGVTALENDTTNTTNHLLLVLGTNWVKGSVWGNEAGENYIYYGNETDASGIIEAATKSLVSPFSKLYLNGEKIDNTYENATIKISIVFQAKQYDNVTWATIGEINWTNGVKDPVQ